MTNLKKFKQQEKQAAAGRTVSSGRGTGRRKLSDIPEPKERPEYKGTISSGRGTGSRKK